LAACGVWASATKSLAECGPRRHAAAPKRRQEIPVTTRTDERRKRFLPLTNFDARGRSVGSLVTGGVTRSGVGVRLLVRRFLLSGLCSAGTSSFPDGAKYLPYTLRREPAGFGESPAPASKSLFTKDLRSGPVLAHSWLSVCLFQGSRMHHKFLGGMGNFQDTGRGARPKKSGSTSN
jgi:hypothetical protein